MNVVITEESLAQNCVFGEMLMPKFQGLFCKTRECCTVVEEFSEVRVCFHDYVLFSWICFISGLPLERSPVKSFTCRFIYCDLKLDDKGCSY